jgi:bifunctional DNA-binding transcriptional regulator/antitoxin component of YhaV-PrlF toxin-antitoxin module
LNDAGNWLTLAQLKLRAPAMTTMILSGKRQVVLPAELCRQVSLAPGARVRVELAPNGEGILVRSASAGETKPASVLFDRVERRGKPLAVEDLQGLAVARKQGKP